MPGYLHGAYGQMASSLGQSADLVAGLPVYVGALPVHLTAEDAGKTHVPLILQNMAEAQERVGYSEDWESFALCEALQAHFDNAIQNVGPICVINVLDPETMRAASDTSVEIPLVGGKGKVTDDKCILRTCAVAGKERGTDFTVTWNHQQQCVEFRDLTGTMTSPVTMTYRQADLAQVDDAAVIGEADAEAGHFSGLQALALVYQYTHAVPTMLLAPGFSEHPAVRTAMVGAAHAIDGHWYAQVLTDIPLSAATLSDARDWKESNGYNDVAEVVHWPQAKREGRTYHLSVLSAVAAMQTDALHDGVPMETPSNMPVDVDGYYIADGVDTRFTSLQANLLNEAGIRTLCFHGGRWALWGAHTAAYTGDDAVDPKEVYDVNLRMLYYLANWFQVEYGVEVDKAISRNRMDAILAQIQTFLDGLQAQGSLLYGTASFEETQRAGDLVKGTFVFHSATTPTPPVRAVVLRVAYTSEGLTDYVTGGEQA